MLLPVVKKVRREAIGTAGKGKDPQLWHITMPPAPRSVGNGQMLVVSTLLCVLPACLVAAGSVFFRAAVHMPRWDTSQGRPDPKEHSY